MTWQDLADGVMTSALAAFAETVSYTPSGESAFDIQGIFNDIFDIIDDQNSDIVSSKPTLGVRSSDFEMRPKIDDTVVVRGITYSITEVQRDGEAGYNLFLHKVI